METEVSNLTGTLHIGKVIPPDHLGRIKIEIRMGDRYLYHGVEDVIKTIEILSKRRDEMIVAIQKRDNKKHD